MVDRMGSVLSIDYGLKRIGLAISDPLRKFAFPLTVLENKGFTYVLSSIKEIIKDREIELIIIGIPYNLNSKMGGQNVNSKNDMQETIEKFVEKLQKDIKVSIKKVDERYSSFLAEENLKEAGLNSKKSKSFVDLEAARLLLEEFLKDGKAQDI